MEFVAVLNDPILGKTISEHSGHEGEEHVGIDITGSITGNVSNKVKIKGLGVATIGSTTTEFDGCCLGNNSGGIVVTGSKKVTIDGKPIALVGSKVESHNGTSYVISSSQSIIKSV